MINKWITIKVDERKFEVYVREIGGEIYSLQAHPNKSNESNGMDCSVSRASSVVKEMSPSEMGRTTEVSRGCLNSLNGGHDPVLENALIRNSENVKGFNDGNANCDDSGMIEKHDEGREIGVILENDDALVETNRLQMCNDLFVAQNDVSETSENGPRIDITNNGLQDNEIGVDIGLSDKDVPISPSSCPYPPGFGPCTSSNHVHHDNPTHVKHNDVGVEAEMIDTVENPKPLIVSEGEGAGDKEEAIIAKEICE
ncbi:hypothetical protein PIB30_070151 [Stylosanthes scabra]|uniref:Uncharacterized protein n=1 Tax=Stylosanthes scabra TaxID=79078 RepID=A0ABU6ZM26_9FABA|nr:hypothetical protein [Stylosanthes scabra]